MSTNTRLRLLPLLLAGGALFLLACGGSGTSDRTAGASASMAGQAEMPTQARNPDLIFEQADRAFQSGDYARAQLLFGELFIVAPRYRGNLPTEALQATCRRLENDCDWVMPRIVFVQAAFEGRFNGPRSRWVAEQERDYMRIKECYDRAIMGDYRGAVEVGTPVTRAPFPPFAQAAQDCVSRAGRIVQERERRERADQALQAWHANYPCMDTYRRQLLVAADDEDWETFAQAYPQYETCARIIQSIVDDGVLAGDNRLGMQHDLAWTQLDEIAFLLEDHGAEIENARQGALFVQSDRAYNERLAEYRSIAGQISEMDNRLRSLHSAMGAVGPAERAALEGQISSMERARASLVARREQLVDELNAMRARAGLNPRSSFD